MSTESEKRVWAERWCRRIAAQGLSPVALSLVEFMHAFGFLGSQMLLMIQPLLTSIVDDAALERAIALLNSPELQDWLRLSLEEGESQGK